MLGPLAELTSVLLQLFFCLKTEAESSFRNALILQFYNLHYGQSNFTTLISPSSGAIHIELHIIKSLLRSRFCSSASFISETTKQISIIFGIE
jgi:hypothetical protein